MILEATDPRALKISAVEMCRQIAMTESDDLSSYLNPTAWNGQATPALRFHVKVNGRTVDEDGNVDRGHSFDAKTFYGPEGLVEAWALIAVMTTRAESLGITITPSIEYDAEVRVTRPWRALALSPVARSGRDGA